MLFSDRKAMERGLASTHRLGAPRARLSKFAILECANLPSPATKSSALPARRMHARERRFQCIYFISNISGPSPLDACPRPRRWPLINERG